MLNFGTRACVARIRQRDREAGVTLIEMMVVLVIIAIVAVLVVPNVIGRPDQARVTVTRTDLRTVANALEMYRLDNRRYPTSRQGLRALVERPTDAPLPVNWSPGGYLAGLPKDAWGNPLVYVSPGETAAFDLRSLGADGNPGGTGLDADLDLRDGLE